MTRNRIFKYALIVIIALNIWGALPAFYYAPWEPITVDNVSVYTPEEPPSDPTVPIMRIDNSTKEVFVPTGQKVNVFIRSAYRDVDAQRFPRLTLLIILVALFLSRFAKQSRTPNQPGI